YCLSLSDGGKTLVSQGSDYVRIWQLSADQKTIKAKGQKGLPGPFERVTLSPDGAVLAYSSTDLPILLWEAATGKQLAKLGTKQPSLSQLAFSPDGRALAAKEYGRGKVHLWDLTTRKELPCLEERDIETTECIAFSPDGRLLAVGGSDGVISLWEIASAKKVARFQGPKRIHSLAFSPDGRTVAAGDGEHCTILVWDVAGRFAEDKQRPGALMPSKELA